MSFPSGTLSLLLALGACGDSVTQLSAAELVADPDRYDGALLDVTGSPDGAGLQNLVACDHDGPCNNLWGPYYYVGDEAFITLRPADPDAWTVVAKGETPQMCFDSGCLEGVTFGCHGNDVEAVCAPAVPARIRSVIGRLEGDVLYVDELVLGEGPSADGIYREVE
jgi:hypothetical protein